MGKSKFVDMIKLASMLKYKAVPDIKMAVHIIEEIGVAETGIRPELLGDDMHVYRAAAYFASFNKPKLRQAVRVANFTSKIDRMDTTHYLNGGCYVIMHPDEYAKVKNRYFIEVGGRLSSVNYSDCIFMLAKWRKGNTGSKAFSAYMSPKMTFAIEDEDKPYFIQSAKQRKFIQPENISKGQEMGVEIENPILVSEDSTYTAPLGEIGIKKAKERYDGILPPVKPADVQNIAEPIVPIKQQSFTPQESESKVSDLNRSAFLPKFEELTAKYNDLEARQEAIDRYILEAVPISDEDWVEKYIAILGETISKNWFGKPEGNNGYSGSMLFKFVVEDILGEEDARMLWDLYSHTTKIVDRWKNDDLVGDLASLGVHRTRILYALLEKILGLNCNLYLIDLQCKKKDRTVFDFIQSAPYRLGLVVDISLKDMDKLALIEGFYGKAKSNNDRSIAFYHEYLTDPNKMHGSTLMLEQNARLIKPGYYITRAEYMRLDNSNFSHNHGIPFDDNFRVNVTTYLKVGVSSLFLPRAGWQKDPSSTTSVYLPTETVSSFEDYLSSNIGVKLQLESLYIADFSVYKKELYIYQKLYDFNAPFTKPMTDDELDACIRKFELSQGSNFKLEQRQREAIKNCFISENSVYTTTGGAGSGKTTLISGILYVYTVGYGYKEEDIVMVAPTGKAATQITEKTGYPAKTIHSEFKIGLPFDRDAFKAKVVIIDESSMINLDLMYQLMQRIPNNCRVIFSGDINQLEPIGFGQPFADSLNFTPVVTLNVMKRAEAGSAINRNAKRMTEGYEKLDQDKDFRIINEQNYIEELKMQIDNLLKNGCSLRDIQVISPVSTDKYGWGTQKLNVYLQTTYNKANRANTLFHRRYGADYVFKVGDPVIHTENNYDMPHYLWEGRTLNQAGEGIRNGEIGYVKKIWKGEDLSDYLDEDTELYLNCTRHNAIVLEVEYSTAGDTYSLFYHSKNVDRDGHIGVDGYNVTGGNLATLQLAYAITVHKMQGSQAPHIIIMWYEMRNSTFLSRNMLYTACTRAQQTVTILGDMPAITKARHIISSDMRYSYIKKYFAMMVKK